MKTDILTNNHTAVDQQMSRTHLRPDSMSGPCRCHVLAILVACLTVFGVGNAWGASFSTSYGYSNMGTSADKTWNLTDYEDKSSYWRCPASGNTSVATIPDVFKGKYITSAVTITINHATYGSGTNPSEQSFQMYTSSSCSVRVNATQTGTLATNDSYKDVVYTISAADAAYLGDDLSILITKPGKTIRLKSITVAFTYSAASTYTVTWKNNGTTHASTSVTQGRKATFPSTPTSCDGTSTTFYGWSTAEWSGKLDDVSAKTIYTTQETMPAPTANVTYYAVFGVPGDETSATFTASNISSTPATSNALEWKHTASGALLHLSGGQRYTGGSPNTFTIAPGSTNYAVIAGVYITKVVAACTSTTYRLTAASAGTFTNPSSSNYQTAGVNDFEVKMYAGNGNNQARVTTFTVYYKPFSAYLTKCAACDADPTIGAVSLNGSFNSGGVTSLTNTVSFSTTSCDPNTNCEWVDYGFVWGTSASPTVSNTKMQKGTDGDATSWDMTSPSAFTADNTYYVRAYGKNGKAGAAFVYSSSDLTFTPRSVAFNSNGGSAVSTKYIKSGGAMTAPTAPTKTGYNFDSWRTDAGLGTAVSWPSTINSSTTYYAKWNAKTYAITLNANGGSGSSPASVNATYNAHALSSAITNPTKTDYIFQGWNTKADGSGLTVINTDGELIASVSGYTDGSGNWTKDGTETLYAKWQEHTYTNYRTLCCTNLGAISGTVTFNSPVEAKVKWNKIDHVDSWTLKYKVHGAGAWTTAYTDKTSSDSEISESDDDTDGINDHYYSTIDVSCNTAYDFLIIANPASNYCDKEEELNNSGSGYGSGTWTVTSTGVTDVTPASAIPSTTCDGFSIASMTPASGYHLPSSITVTNADHTWNSSTGALTISNVVGNVTITITGEENTCDGYSFHTGGSDVWNTRAENKCFVQDGVTKRWYISNYTITSNTHFCLNWQGGQYDRGGDNNVRFMTQPWTEMSLAYGRSGKVGVATGAVGTIQIYANSSDDNLYVGFIPDGYVLKYNGVDEAMTQSSTYVWYAPTPYTLNSTTQGYTAAVGLNDGSDNYVACDNTAAVKHIFVKVDHSDWTAATAKYEIYNIQTSSFLGEYMRAVPGETNLYEGWIPSGCTSIIIARCNPGADIPTGNTWTNVWNQSQDISLDGSKNYYTINSKDGSNKYYGAWSVYERSGKWYLDLDGTTTGGQKNFSCYFYPHYVLHYDANSGSGAPADQAVALDASPCQLTVSSTVPTRAGYTFLGWNPTKASADAGTKDDAWDGGDTHAMTADVTLYAVWAANHTLSYDFNGGDGSSCVGGTKYTGESFTACSSAGSKTGYTFNNWLGSNSTSYTAGTTYTMPNSDLTLTAQWNAQEYTITYKDQGDADYSGSNGASLPTTHTYGVATDLVDGVKSGYRFDGWFDNSTCTGAAVTSIGATDITANTTYYAKWTAVYTVTWYVNGDEWESGVVSGNTQVPSGTKVSALPTAPTSSDCDDKKVFVGWKAAEIDGTSAGNPGGIFTTQSGSPDIIANTDFYAVFADEDGGDFTRVTNVASQISAGKKVIMGYEATPNSGVIVPLQSNALNGTLLYTGTTEGSAGSGTLTMSSMSSGDEAIYAFTIRAGHNSGYWAFEMSGDNAGKYLSHNGKNSITNAESVTNDGKTDFSIVLGTNDVATITNKWGNENTTKDGSNYYNYKIFSYNYNNGNPRAAIYRATQTGDFVMYLCNPLVYSNYVTTCASCDADATFTNTTPAVSAIECTSATLTATGGLATLGAAGCNVSDYGFVIGTADNPAIGGSGVTKLQVGTTNPTTGVNFSYNATGLTKGTHYYIRAYATNRHGTAYSSTQNFWTKNVSSIAITTAPTKTNYIVGETFDATGMVVTATMASGSTEAVTGDVTYSGSALTAGTSQNFPINYTLCETEVSTNQVINVYTLSVTEGTNPSYGTATNSSANIVSVTGLGDHKTYTVTVTSNNAAVEDNGDNTYNIINPTGNVTVRVDYDDAVQVKVYYKVDGVTVTGLTQDVYQSETTTLPTASELATAMAAQSMDLPDDDYPNFVGWSETEFPAQTAEPSIVSGTPTINAEKTYYAVYTNMNVRVIDTDNVITASGYPYSEQTKTVGGVDFKYHYILNGNYSGTHYLQFKSNSTEYGRIYNNTAMSNLIKLEAGYYNSESDVPVYACSAAGTITGSAISAESHEGSDPYVYTFPSNTSYFMVKGDNSTVYKPKWLKIYYCSSTVEYMTQFCTNKVTLSQNSPEHGTIAFGKTSVRTCNGDKNVSLTITPAAGYQLATYSVATGDGKVATKTDPGVSLNNNSNAEQNLTLTFASGANGAYDVTASFTEMVASAWTWTKHAGGATITTDPVEVYVGQKVQVDVSYEPAGLLSSHTNNTAYNYSPSPWSNANLGSPSKAGDHFTVTGTNAGSTSIVLNHNDGLTKTINYTVLALEKVRFVDLVHGKAFADAEATVSGDQWTVSWDGNTPTSDDWTTPNANTCEENHLHLVGWIREDWPALVAYLNGTGDAPATTAIVGAGNDGEGHAYFFAPNASINVQIFNGKTFYAVWAIVE